MRVVFGGFLVALIATIPSAIWYNSTYLLNEEFFQTVKEYKMEQSLKDIETQEKIKKQQGEKVTPMTAKEKEELLHRVEVGSQPGWYTIMFLIMNVVIAVVLSAFTAAFIAKKADYNQS